MFENLYVCRNDDYEFEGLKSINDLEEIIVVDDIGQYNCHIQENEFQIYRRKKKYNQA